MMESIIKDIHFAFRGLRKAACVHGDRSDTQTSLPVAIIDEKLAQMYSGQGELVGRRIRIGGGPWLTIVGGQGLRLAVVGVALGLLASFAAHTIASCAMGHKGRSIDCA